jgi:hypothetical protein
MTEACGRWEVVVVVVVVERMENRRLVRFDWRDMFARS